MRALLFLLGLLPTIAFAQAAPDSATLLATAIKTGKELPTTPASWTVSLSLSPQATLNVAVLQAPPLRRLIFTVNLAQQPPIELARVTETPTTWFVTQQKRHTKHRPYEAEFDYPAVSLAHTLAQPRFLTADVAQKLHPTAIQGDLARYAIPVDNPAPLRNLLAQYEEMTSADPTAPANPATEKVIAKVRSTLEHGLPIAIDTSSGILAEYTTAKLSVSLSNFHFLETAPELQREIDRQAWQDFTTDPTAGGKLDHLVMIGHSASWRPGQPGQDTETLLVNIATGQSRRLPFAGVAALPGCFVRDRTAVVVPGMESDQSNLHLYEIDLKTRANRLLGGDALAVGQTLDPTLSPDGKTIAALYKSGQHKILDFQVVLVDLATGDATIISKPFDGAYLNWLPNGQGLILLKREYTDLKSPSRNTVCRMDLTGAITPLCEGNSPVLLNNQILFEHPGDRKWLLCDLEGKNPHPLGDGLPNHAFPTPSPDGQDLLMLPFKPFASAPVLINLQAPVPHAIPLPAGLWTTPAWR